MILAVESPLVLTQLKAELPTLDIKNQLLSVYPTLTIKVSVLKKQHPFKSIIDWAQHKVSPSSLNTYIACPLQFYYRYIAGIRQEEEVEEFMESSTLGSAIHDALEKGYEDFVGQHLDEAAINEIEQEFECAQHHFTT